MSPLKRQQSHKASPVFFIQTRDDSIDCLVLFSSTAIWTLVTNLTSTLMKIWLCKRFHNRPSYCSPSNIYFVCQIVRYELSPNLQLIFEQSLSCHRRAFAPPSWFRPSCWRTKGHCYCFGQ